MAAMEMVDVQTRSMTILINLNTFEDAFSEFGWKPNY